MRINNMVGRLLLFVFIGLLSCEGNNTVASPVIRVDLRDKLPEKVVQALGDSLGEITCEREITLKAKGASQVFAVAWRMTNFRDSLYITAVGVEPDGETQGGSNPMASAAVGEQVVLAQKGDKVVTKVPLNLHWEAREGCKSVTAGIKLDLSFDKKYCKLPKGSKKKFFSDTPTSAPTK